MFDPYDERSATEDAGSALKRLRALLGNVPEKPIRSLRGARPQEEIAMKSRVSQEQLSRLENGKRTLTPEIAERLATVFGKTSEELEVALALSRVRSMAAEGRIVDMEEYLRAMLSANEHLSDTSAANEIRAAMVEAFKEELESLKVRAVSTKSRQVDGARDTFGRQRNKRYGKER